MTHDYKIGTSAILEVSPVPNKTISEGPTVQAIKTHRTIVPQAAGIQ